MDIDEDDDFYSPDEPTVAADVAKETSMGDDVPAGTSTDTKGSGAGSDDELEEGEEEDEGADMDEDDDEDSDIDIITERKDGSKPDPPPQTRYNDIRNIPQRTATGGTGNTRQPAGHSAKKEEAKTVPIYPTAVPSADKAAAAASSSKLDINGNPVYQPAGKSILQVNIDEDLPDNEKPWRKPGTDITDYFNYGFDEFTWALYAAKQDSLRTEYNQDVIAANNKKMLEDFNMMMMGGMPGMPGAAPPSGPAGGTSGGATVGVTNASPGMDGMTPDMQAMLQQMMASGMDPSQMDPSTMASMFAGMQGQGAGQPQGGYGQAFGGQGQYGYDGMGGGTGGRGRGGRGGRRW